MSTIAHSTGLVAVVHDYLTLLKLRIAAFVGLAALVGGLLGAEAGVSIVRIVEAALWITLSAGAASVFNQVLERDTDRLMERTRHRPIAAGRVGRREAAWFGSTLSVLSFFALAARFNLLTAGLVALTSLAYVLLYTPMKRHTTFNTVVGAFPGAAPPLLGYVALAGDVGPWALALFALLFVWQFPHFMAIAWLYREDYERAGLQMLPSAAGGARVAGRAATTFGLALLPVSLVPVLWGGVGPVYAAGTIALGLGYCVASLRFTWHQDHGTARTLLLASLVYLPLVLALVVFDPATGIAAAHFSR